MVQRGRPRNGPGKGLTSASGLGVPRLCLAAIAVSMAPVGLQAALAPRSFFEDFPVGRGWIAAEGGVYDEHLVRDVGLLFLALVLVTAWAAWRGEFLVPIAVAWLFQGIGHLAYHVAHLEDLGGVDRIGLLVSLVAIPLAAAAALLFVVAPGRARGGPE